MHTSSSRGGGTQPWRQNALSHGMVFGERGRGGWGGGRGGGAPHYQVTTSDETGELIPSVPTNPTPPQPPIAALNRQPNPNLHPQAMLNLPSPDAQPPHPAPHSHQTTGLPEAGSTTRDDDHGDADAGACAIPIESTPHPQPRGSARCPARPPIQSPSTRDCASDHRRTRAIGQATGEKTPPPH